MAVVTRDEFDDWRQHPATIQLMDKISEDLQVMQEMLLDVEEEDLKGLQGRCKVCKNLLDLEYGDLYE